MTGVVGGRWRGGGGWGEGLDWVQVLPPGLLRRGGVVGSISLDLIGSGWVLVGPDGREFCLSDTLRSAVYVFFVLFCFLFVEVLLACLSLSLSAPPLV